MADQPRLRIRREELERLFDQVIEYLVAVSQPLVLVSQIQRSGGTLLSQLLDGHPELHVHPHELHIGHPNKESWPDLALAPGPKRQFELLSEGSHGVLFAEGYRKRMREHPQYEQETFPFLQPPSLTASLFRRLAPREPRAAREILDAYFTAYFNSWLDNHHLRDGPKRWLAAFTPRLAWGGSRARFVSDYPDGRLIAILRQPHDWYASAREHHPSYADCEQAMAQWERGAQEMVAASRERPNATLVVRFEDLVLETESVMRHIADWLGIAFATTLAMPTFNDLPIRADSSFAVDRPGVLRDAVGRGRELSSADAQLIDRLASEAYDEALKIAWRPD